MEIRHFWLLAKNINRIQAQLDLRQLDILLAVQSQDALSKVREALESQVGMVLEVDQGRMAIATAVYERDKLLALKKRK